MFNKYIYFFKKYKICCCLICCCKDELNQSKFNNEIELNIIKNRNNFVNKIKSNTVLDLNNRNNKILYQIENFTDIDTYITYQNKISSNFDMTHNSPYYSSNNFYTKSHKILSNNSFINHLPNNSIDHSQSSFDNSKEDNINYSQKKNINIVPNYSYLS